MKYKNLAALLAIEIVCSKKWYEVGEAVVPFNEQQLETIEKALEEKDTSAFEGRIAELEKANEEARNTAENYKARIEEMEKALASALELNGIASKESTVENITELGAKCKEFGDKGNGHTQTPNNGVEKNDDYEGVVNMNDAHNQVS